MDTLTDGLEKVDSEKNLAILGIYVRFLGKFSHINFQGVYFLCGGVTVTVTIAKHVPRHWCEACWGVWFLGVYQRGEESSSQGIWYLDV